MITSNTIKELKVNNRQIIFDCVKDYEDPQLSCAKIAKLTGISLPTVIKVADYFMQKGILTERNPDSIAEHNAVGRPPGLLQFNPNAFYALGAAYDGKYMDIALINLRYEIVVSKKLRVRIPVWEMLSDSFADEVNGVLNDSDIPAHRLTGIGIALPVAVDVKNYSALFPAPLIGLHTPHDFSDIFTRLSQRFGCPAFIENDVNAAAIGEFKEKRLPRGSDLVYITLGNGLGCGLILNGKLRRGANYSAGEMGYMSFNDAGNLEEKLSAAFLLKQFGYNAYDENQHETGAVNGTTQKIRVADHISKYLSHGIRNTAALLDVDHYVLGGFLIEQLKEPIFQFTRERLDRFELGRINITYASNPHIAAQGIGALVIDKTIRNQMEDQV